MEMERDTTALPNWRQSQNGSPDLLSPAPVFYGYVFVEDRCGIFHLLWHVSAQKVSDFGAFGFGTFGLGILNLKRIQIISRQRKEIHGANPRRGLNAELPVTFSLWNPGWHYLAPAMMCDTTQRALPTRKLTLALVSSFHWGSGTYCPCAWSLVSSSSQRFWIIPVVSSSSRGWNWSCVFQSPHLTSHYTIWWPKPWGKQRHSYPAEQEPR